MFFTHGGLPAVPFLRVQTPVFADGFFVLMGYALGIGIAAQNLPYTIQDAQGLPQEGFTQ